MKSYEKVVEACGELIGEMKEKGWRPKGWKTPSDLADDRPWVDELYPEFCADLYEAGADAMYEALWKLAEESPTKTFTIDANLYQVFGRRRNR